MCLNQLDAATALDVLRIPQSNHLELLKGIKKADTASALTINGGCVFNLKTLMPMLSKL